MNSRPRQHGFTLIELLVAIVLIATVLSMAYGSYIATTRSAQACKSRITLSEQGRSTLEQMSRHVRCSYSGSDYDRDRNVPAAGSTGTEIELENSPDYFSGDAHAPNGEILHLVTASGSPGGNGAKDGLFEVVYRLDRRKRELALSQTRFAGESEGTGTARDWQVIAEGVKSVDLAFFDGDKWLPRWEFRDRKGLPRAVRIEITGENESGQRCRHGTVVHVACRNYRTATETERPLPDKG